MMGIIDEDAKDSYLEWSTTFKKKCTARCLAKGDEAVVEENYEKAIELYSAGIGLDSSCDLLFAHRSKAHLDRNLYAEALHDANMAIKLNPLSYLGHQVNHAALHKARRYDEAIEALKIILSKFDNTSDPQIQKGLQQYVSPSEADGAILRAIDAQLENAPFRLLNTSTGLLCDRGAQIDAFMKSTEYKEILSSSTTCAPLQTETIKGAVAKYFGWAMLSHRWQSNELLLHDIQGKVVYDLAAVGTTVKLQTFCKMARDAGHCWAWSDTCCIDQKNNVELQASVNSMFVWYRHSALTIVYLSDVSPSSESGALAKSVWNTRGWTVQEFLASNIVLFYRADWTPYLNDHSSNHKESVAIIQELKDSTGIDARALIAFHPGMRGAREKLQWASNRVTTLPEDIAYSLFGIFGVHLPVIYGETRQNALGRLLQAIVAQSGDITALDWVGKPSQFNSILPADISSYNAPPCTSLSLSEHQIQISVSSLQNATVVEQALTLYTRLANLSPPRFADRRLQLPCIAFPVTALRRRRDQDRETYFTYDVKAVGLDDLLITTEDKLRSASRTFLLICPWNRHDLGLLGDADDAQSVDDWSEPDSPSGESFSRYPGDDGPVELESSERALRLLVRLGQPFGALLLAQQQGGEYKRIASDHNIIAQVKDMVSVGNMMDVRTLEIL
ncbi:heterokaryon incompatibility protein-domain-containing protein [Suillus ampliporus]|nr:heterokaryon incompatibility protein-domain-containing protein [Suillus ampliporus]